MCLIIKMWLILCHYLPSKKCTNVMPKQKHALGFSILYSGMRVENATRNNNLGITFRKLIVTALKIVCCK